MTAHGDPEVGDGEEETPPRPQATSSVREKSHDLDFLLPEHNNVYSSSSSFLDRYAPQTPILEDSQRRIGVSETQHLPRDNTQKSVHTAIETIDLQEDKLGIPVESSNIPDAQDSQSQHMNCLCEHIIEPQSRDTSIELDRTIASFLLQVQNCTNQDQDQDSLTNKDNLRAAYALLDILLEKIHIPVSQQVVNLSSRILNRHELSVLTKGLSFCPTPGEPSRGISSGT